MEIYYKECCKWMYYCLKFNHKIGLGSSLLIHIPFLSSIWDYKHKRFTIDRRRALATNLNLLNVGSSEEGIGRGPVILTDWMIEERCFNMRLGCEILPSMKRAKNDRDNEGEMFPKKTYQLDSPTGICTKFTYRVDKGFLFFFNVKPLSN